MYVLLTKNDDQLQPLVGAIAGQGGYCKLWEGRVPPHCSGIGDFDTPLYIVGHSNGDTFTSDRINYATNRITGAQAWADILRVAPNVGQKPFIVILGCSAADGSLAGDIAAASGKNVVAAVVPILFEVSRIHDMATSAIARTPGGIFEIVEPTRLNRPFMSIVECADGVPRHVTGRRWQNNEAVPLISCNALNIRLYD